MSLSNYPPGFGSSRDLDHVEGPKYEEEMDEHCPDCDGEMFRLGWRSGPPSEVCTDCDYQREGQEIEQDGPW